MKEFLVGLAVVIAMLLLSVVAVLMLPFIVVLGFFLKWLIMLAFIIFSIWLIGKLTLYVIEKMRK